MRAHRGLVGPHHGAEARRPVDPPHREVRRPAAAAALGPQRLTPRQLDPESLGDHVDRLYRAAWSLTGSREEAEDLVQETFARVLRKPRLLRSEDDLGYLLRVLRNTYFTERRASQRRPEPLPFPDEHDRIEDPAAPSPQAHLEAAELYAVISQLPADFRDVLVAIDVVGLSYREAARALKIREATITTRLHRARQRVARSLVG